MRTKERKERLANVKLKTARQLRAKKNKEHMHYTSEKSHKKMKGNFTFGLTKSRPPTLSVLDIALSLMRALKRGGILPVPH